MKTNALLSAVPSPVAQRLLGSHQRRTLPRRTVLHDAGERFESAYFPLNGMLSLLSMTEDGETVEVMSVGREAVSVKWWKSLSAS